MNETTRILAVSIPNEKWGIVREWIVESLPYLCFVSNWSGSELVNNVFPIFPPQYLLFYTDEALALFVLFWAHHIKDSRY